MPNTTIYTIQPGDSLARIARTFGVSTAALMAANPIRPGGLIYPGERLQVPVAGTPATGTAVTRTVTQSGLPVDRSRRLPGGQFFPQKQTKDLVVLHFTAGGSVDSAYQAWLSTRERVATAYLVDLDGRIYEVFDPEGWASHLGVGAANNPGFRQDKRSIGIEIVNWGGLKAGPGDQLYCWPNGYRTRYGHLADTGRYVRKSFRGFDYFAAFPSAQMQAVCRLTRQLCEQFGIPKRIPDSTQRERLDWAYYGDYRGVASHQNFHSEKSDIGPAFDWEEIDRALTE